MEGRRIRLHPGKPPSSWAALFEFIDLLMRVHILILQPHMSNGMHSNSDNLGVQPFKKKKKKRKTVCVHLLTVICVIPNSASNGGNCHLFSTRRTQINSFRMVLILPVEPINREALRRWKSRNCVTLIYMYITNKSARVGLSEAPLTLLMACIID